MKGLGGGGIAWKVGWRNERDASMTFSVILFPFRFDLFSSSFGGMLARIRRWLPWCGDSLVGLVSVHHVC